LLASGEEAVEENAPKPEECREESNGEANSPW
jgi:hypothetical protein